MTLETGSSLAGLPAYAYVDEAGQLPEAFQGKIGVYAIFDQAMALQYVGYSRDVLLSLKQHLVRKPSQCVWVKAQISDRPNRTELEAIRAAWIAENGTTPPGNTTEDDSWNQPIDVKQQMTEAEQATYAAAPDELTQIKLLKQCARRVEAEILEQLRSRNVQTEIRFNPKMKETGLLDLKP
ncbi:MAG TPA: GIY-YIG nuclease family protein [Leptolyngbyaceae cyanobacterium M33_DOE_097]|uniref:GIY-YIG nuclease family protein n=1 Tax=Oscillatoriales cyanobacterium SpSt-418 TaxID=2282169 RepID=A0A7C3KBK2_9CYAN|nr:GIY-YIG nuclease family protein [Leptolyngbyaceae cyanobacterium M33_DOE_097]